MIMITMPYWVIVGQVVFALMLGVYLGVLIERSRK